MLDELLDSNEISVETITNIFFNNLNEQSIKELQSALLKKQSLLDKSVNDTYHAIEYSTLSHVSISHKLCSHLKDLLIQRRLIKQKISLCTMLLNDLTNINNRIKQINNNNNKVKAQSIISLNKILSH